MSGEKFELPLGWSVAPLEDVADSWLGKMLDKAKHTSGKKFPYLRNINVRWGYFDLSDVAEMYFDDHELDRYDVCYNDVLVCEGGEPGRAAVWKEPVRGYKFQKAIHRIRPSEALLPEWLVFSLKLDADRGYLSQHFTGTTIKHLTGASISRYRVRLPPLNEQKRIVAKLEALQARSTAAKQALDAIPPLLEKLRQSVLAAAFRGDLTRAWREAHPDVEPASVLLERIRTERRRKWEQAKPAKTYVAPEPIAPEGLPELPEGWCWASAAELVEPGADIVYGIVQPGPPLDGGVPYVRGTDIQDEMILVDQLWRTSPEIAAEYRRSAIQTGDVLLCIIRHLKVAVVPSVLNGGNLSRTTARLRPSSVVTTSYLADVLRSPFCQGWLKSNYRGGTSMPKVNIGDVVRLPIPLAPIDEQRAVSANLAAMFSGFRRLVDATLAGSVVHSTLNQSILAKAFRGELVPQDPTDEPASALLERIRAERESAATTTKPRATKRPRKPTSTR